MRLRGRKSCVPPVASNLSTLRPHLRFHTTRLAQACQSFCLANMFILLRDPVYSLHRPSICRKGVCTLCTALENPAPIRDMALFDPSLLTSLFFVAGSSIVTLGSFFALLCTPPFRTEEQKHKKKKRNTKNEKDKKHGTPASVHWVCASIPFRCSGSP